MKMKFRHINWTGRHSRLMHTFSLSHRRFRLELRIRVYENEERS